MRSISKLALILPASFALIVCGSPDPPEPTIPEGDAVSKLTEEQRTRFLAKGKEASDALMKGLGAQLKAAMGTGGPKEAIKVCKAAALPITAATSKKFEGIAISRTSLKPRNPANTPDDTDRAVLESWEKAGEGDSVPEPELQADPDGVSIRYYKPILIAEVCLNCHGPSESLEATVKDILKEQYPEDKATGYGLGDLRGAFKVVIDPSGVADE